MNSKSCQQIHILSTLSFHNSSGLYHIIIAFVHTIEIYLGDKDQAARMLFVQHPRKRRMMQSKPERSEGFDEIIRPAPEGA